MPPTRATPSQDTVTSTVPTEFSLTILFRPTRSDFIGWARGKDFFLHVALVAGVLLAVARAHADVVLTAWTPIFKGIERAAGTNTPTTFFTNNQVAYANGTLQVATCLRIDLQDPDVRLFTSPRATNYVLESSETYSISVSNFIKKYGVQVASVANFYQTFSGGNWTADPVLDGLPSRIFGLSICTGQVVSVPDFGPVLWRY